MKRRFWSQALRSSRTLHLDATLQKYFRIRFEQIHKFLKRPHKSVLIVIEMIFGQKLIIGHWL